MTEYVFLRMKPANMQMIIEAYQRVGERDPILRKFFEDLIRVYEKSKVVPNAFYEVVR